MHLEIFENKVISLPISKENEKQIIKILKHEGYNVWSKDEKLEKTEVKRPLNLTRLVYDTHKR